jgi:hypothetical protein
MKIEKLDDRARKNLNIMCTTLGYNFPLGDWINAVNEVLAKLDDDTGVTDTDYGDLRTDQ